MKLVLRILPTVFVLISGTAFADITASDMTWDFIVVSARGAQADLRGVSYTDFPPLPVAVAVEGAPSTSWFGPPNNFSPGESVLGPGTITWDNNFFLAIGSNFYGAGLPGTFSVFPTTLDLPFITLPPPPTTGGTVFEATLFPRFVFELDGTILTGPCFGSCNFKFRSARGELTFNWHYQDGAWHALGLRLNSLPEPGTLPLLVIGFGALGWRKFRAASLARGRSSIPV